MYHKIPHERSDEAVYELPYKSVLIARAETQFLGADLDYDTDGLWKKRAKPEEVSYLLFLFDLSHTLIVYY